MNTNSFDATTLPLHNSKLVKPQDTNNQSLVLIQATTSLDQPTQQQKKSIARIYSEQACIFFQEQNWHKAIIACKNALETDANHVDAYKILGNILQRQGKKAEALGVYAKALAVDPNSAPIYANLGSFYAEQKNWRQALDYFQQAAILDPNLAGVHRSLAQIWEELGDPNQALEHFCQAVNLEPETLTAAEYFNFAQELHRQEKLQEASIFYIQGVKLAPQAEAELTQLVKILEELEEWQQAVVYYHQLISLSDSHGDRQNLVENQKPIKNLLSRAKSQRHDQQKNQSQQQQKKTRIGNTAISSLPASPTAQLIAQSDQSDKNSEILTVVSTQSNLPANNQPTSAVAWNNLGSAYAQKKEWDKAIDCYQKSVQLKPDFIKGYRNLARVHQKLGEMQKAALCWYEACSLEPAQASAAEHFKLAKSLLEQNQIDQAIACLERAVELEPSLQKAHLILGKVLESQGKRTAAQEHYTQIGGQTR